MGRRPRVPAAVLALLRAGEHHAWALDEVAAALARRGTPADFSTVFRAVERLEAAGALRKVDLADGRTRVELAADHHDHLQCEVCGQLTPLPCGLADGAVGQVFAATGFAATGHRLVFTGICAACRRHRAENERPAS